MITRMCGTWIFLVDIIQEWHIFLLLLQRKRDSIHRIIYS